VSSILPVHNYTERAQIFFPTRSMDKVRALNVWLKNFAARNHYPYVDYYSAMLDEHGLLKRELADDGLHPNAAGYALMVKMLAPTVESVLAVSAHSTTGKGH
jgi:lysophospholipase L1-like esterase